MSNASPTPDAHCPPIEELYALAEATTADTPLPGHLSTCEKCRNTWRRIIADRSLAGELAQAHQSPRPPARPAQVQPAAELPAGTHIAEYTIDGVLGAGGMGVVYRAEQAHPKRRVALKLLRADLATARVLRRFELEAAALALLKHPAIAQVYQAGTVTVAGSPRAFLAMELVDGPRLDEFAKSSSLSRHERLLLLAQIADGVEHAHRRGIIHRDLKPANILVERSDDNSPRPRILDFGVAKFADATTHQVEQTQAGGFVGTLAYAAPEQVGGDPQAIDARADVFALGVILYELVVGTRPRSLGQTLADAVQTIASGRITPPSAHGVSVDGELLTILTTALACDPESRYQSAAALAEDIRRYIDKRPLRARPESTWYTFRKAVSRHPWRAGASIAVLAILTAFGAATVSAQIRASIADRKQGSAFRTVFEAIDMTDQDEDDAPIITNIEAFLDEAVKRVNTQLADFPGEKNAVLYRLGRAYRAHKHLQKAEPILAGVVEFRRAEQPPQPLPLADAVIDLGRVRVAAGQFESARDLMAEGHQLRLSALGERHPLTIDARYRLGSAYHAWKKYDVAESHFRAALDAQRALDPSAIEVGEYLNALAACVRAQGNFEQALAIARETLAFVEQTRGENHKHAAVAISNVAANLISLERYQEAEPLLNRGLKLRTSAFGEEDPRVADALVQIAALNMRLGDWGSTPEQLARLETAAAHARQALALRRRVHAGDHESIAEVLSILGQIAMRRRAPDACTLLREVVDMRERLPRRHEGDLGRSRSLLGECLRRSGDLAGAESLLREGLATLERAYSPTHRHTLDALARWRDWLIDAGRESDAREITARLKAARQ